MNIGIFTDTYLPDINGVVTSVVTLKKTLEANGHNVYIVTNYDGLLKTTYKDKVLRLPGLKLDFLYKNQFPLLWVTAINLSKCTNASAT